jgi:predicted enzyme related to lactoylglutathione lyase
VRLAAARIFVRDVSEATAFYEGALGWRVGARAPEVEYVVFEAGSVDVVVERVGPEAPPEEQALVGRFTGLSFAVADIRAVCLALEGAGVRITSQPERQEWGGTLATVQDPSGNELQLVQYPSVHRP